jgi:exopolysaccharide/PEP-CTERM locus tyrosine autokinase
VSIIETALKKLHGANSVEPKPTSSSTSAAPRSTVPIARKKKIVVEGSKHHVEQAALVRAGLLAPLDEAAATTDEFRRIKRPLLANAMSKQAGDAHMGVIMITSALPGAGKTFCSVNLAASISLEREVNVLLVDADVAKPHISREFGLADAPGLIDLLIDDKLDMEEVLVRTDLNDIQILPAGRRHAQATELLASDRMSVIIHELATRYGDRMVLLDSPPLLVTSESPALASKVGQIVLIVEAGNTSHQELAHVLHLLDTNKAINVILNKTRSWTRFGEYYMNYGYGQSTT